MIFRTLIVAAVATALMIQPSAALTKNEKRALAGAAAAGAALLLLNEATKAKPKARSKKAYSGCGNNKIRIDGKCIRRSEATSYCGPGYKVRGGTCVSRYADPAPSQKKCPKGQVWTSQEGCHYDD